MTRPQTIQNAVQWRIKVGHPPHPRGGSQPEPFKRHLSMSKTLSDETVERYHRDGYFFPVPILDAERVRACRSNLERFERETGHPLGGAERNKAHLLFRWVDDLMREERVLDLVEDLLGPDILCWNTLFWIKEANSSSFVSWHQDARYWGLDSGDLVTVWLALSPANEQSGCMRVLPGSHREAVLPHRDRYQENNLLTRGQEISVEVDESKTVSMVLEPGEVSVHNIRLAHASGPNQTADRRIGLALNYIPTRARQIAGSWDCAALVRGEDCYRHFEHTPIPPGDFDPELVRLHKRATDSMREILFSGAERVRETL